MKAKMMPSGSLVDREGVFFTPESSDEKAFLLRAMDLCKEVSCQEKSSTMELARALHEAIKEPGMRHWEQLTAREMSNKIDSVLLFLSAWKKCVG